MHGPRVAEARVSDKPPAIILAHRSAPKPDLMPFDPRHQAVMPAVCPDVEREPSRPASRFTAPAGSVGRVHAGYDDVTDQQFEDLDICETLEGMLEAHGVDRIARLLSAVCLRRGVHLPTFLAKGAK
jgi:hypothetical protein